ncbi:NAD(P)/FAD-dependent oxidoreductase [Rhizobium sp. L1K21]|uniref:NAD(P)/FAD-dependent oxidoreductase n=1 Tax=Rhizobium sp. L1K21 TaxID=2954933 RepID=UPI002093A119|nr:NAD(P)/FAD-dependent oxidoreductase [Rhizobium sp. L1K21]MCO6187834.1 NAD(P)/FAD-dependent oxidoreductase [Rhizobium sp. L1K21]
MMISKTENEDFGAGEGGLSGALLQRPRRIVIVGGGFGGLACASALGGAKVNVTMVDRRNHNLFQPLLYQVATAILSPASISEPLRRTLGRHNNIHVVMAEVTGIDTVRKAVIAEDGAPIEYDTLVIATGSKDNYFGNDTWREFAPGLKSNRDARLIRERLLTLFERAELAENPEERRACLTSVIIGGGPTGVELAGAIAELGRFLIPRDFKNISIDELRIVLLEAAPGILSGFDKSLSDYAQKTLEKKGVEVRVNTPVEAIEDGGVTAGGERFETCCTIWGAGVKATPVAEWLGLEAGRGGRVPVEGDLSVKGLSDIYIVGDAALALDENGKPFPALAQVAKQQGRYLGKKLRAERHSRSRSDEPFRFKNRGITAVIGRNAAIFEAGRLKLTGRTAWFLWAIVHVLLLVNFEKRFLVSTQWMWTFFTKQRNARLIDERS